MQKANNTTRGSVLQEAPKARESLVIMTLQDLSTEGRAEGALALGTGAAQRLNRHGWTWGSPQPESKHRIPLAPTEADGLLSDTLCSHPLQKGVASVRPPVACSSSYNPMSSTFPRWQRPTTKRTVPCVPSAPLAVGFVALFTVRSTLLPDSSDQG